MTQPTRILVPSYSKNVDEGYYMGYLSISCDNATTIYLTRFSYSDLIEENSDKQNDNIVFGYYGRNSHRKKLKMLPNILIFNKEKTLLQQLIINGQCKPTNNVILIEYDYCEMRDSQTIPASSDNISELQRLIHKENGVSQTPTTNTPHFEISHWLASSMFLDHIYNCVNLLKWFANTVKREKKISIKQGNLILALLTDVILGYIMLQLVTQDTKYISSQVMDILENLIKMLYSLLTWLMGAPVGLKLNNAFNKMLGKYFSYHVQLWWLFLDTSRTKLDTVLQVYYYIGFLGFTFQIAMISDMICLATFHSYCIYVYAARLFNIQISGLIALLRLFVGRKYNPLRGGIDSCEYTNQELFVGTVAFTILLLLLPTTTMYYIVFTMFRVLSIIVQYIFSKLIYTVQTLPLYVCTLWMTKSSKVAGNILLEVESTEDASPLILRLKLFSKSIIELIREFKPPAKVLRPVEWSKLVSNILKGKQMI